MAAAVLGVCLSWPQVAAVAGPALDATAPDDLSSVLVGPPSLDYVAKPNGMSGATHIGPLDLEALVAERNDSPTVRSDLVRQGFTRGYRKVWVQPGTSAVLIERVEEYRYNVGAEDHLVRARLADARTSDFRGFFDVSSVGTADAYGERDVSPDDFETDNVIFVKGNLLLVVAAGRPDQGSVAVAVSQARAQYVSAPYETRDQVGAPDRLPPPAILPAGSRPNLVAAGVIGGVLLLAAIPVLLVVLLAVHQRSRRPYPLLSADRRYWWDGSAWRDTAVWVPDGAPRSPDGAYWFDGVTWRPVVPNRAE